MPQTFSVEAVTVGEYATHCYLVATPDGEALVIDPGAEADRLIRRIEERRLRVVGYPLTHGHRDHVGALAEVHARFPAPIGLHPTDAAWAFSPNNRLFPWEDPVAAPPGIDLEWEDGQAVDMGPFRFEVVFLPGHTPGGVGLWFEDDHTLFGGDTLFAGSVGRTDLPGGDFATLQQSLRRLLDLPPETRVFPGHGPATTLAEEIRSNPCLADLR